MVTVSTEQWKTASPALNPWEPAVEECLLWREYQVRPGMRLAVQNVRALRESVSYSFIVEETAPVSFMCFVSGTTRITMTDRSGTRHDIENNAGDCSLCHLPGSRGQSSTHPGAPIQAAGLLVMPEFLQKASTPTKFSNTRTLFTAETDAVSFHWKDSLPPHVALTVREIVHCPLEGSRRQVFMEYKAMELLFSLMTLLDEKGTELGGVTPVERHAALAARDTILASLVEPPSLQKLAGRVGLTHTRLNAVFQLLFGTTVFRFLREKRLERARHLLEKPGQGIAETAYECGFSSPSHFTRAFAIRYGMTPSRYHAECMPRVPGRPPLA
ncbi:MAG: AraC family transcriptional regulator [Deltaproteobacteria bacterium]|nr:AraC family transcriptional regulator [Deltaproteobacteria bacterium]